jgi:PAS domain S-box-containing protein
MLLPATVAPVFERAAIPLTLADAGIHDHPLVLANDAFLTLTGHSRDDVVGRNCRFLQRDGANDESRAEIRRLLAEGREGVARLVNYRKTGERFEVLLFLHPIFDQAREIRYVLGSQYDVTSLRSTRTASHLSQLGDIIGEANAAIRDGGNMIVSSMQVMADVTAGMLRRSLLRD